MIVIALGANLPTDEFGSPESGFAAALTFVSDKGIKVVRRSRLYRSAPVPPSGQPWYINAVATVETGLGPHDLLGELLAIETRFGRVRHGRNDPRVLDLDLIDYDGQVGHWAGEGARPALDLPHPRLAARAFVLTPLAEIAPEWCHPVTGAAIHTLLAALSPDQIVQTIGNWPG